MEEFILVREALLLSVFTLKMPTIHEKLTHIIPSGKRNLDILTVGCML